MSSGNKTDDKGPPGGEKPEAGEVEENDPEASTEPEAPDNEEPPSRFAQTDEDAAARFEEWEKVDPLPSIAASLLGSAEIGDYVSATGMVFPFYEQPGKLKPASYEVDFKGRVIYWDDEGERRDENFGEGDKFVLRRNSIAFAEVEPKFRIPNYIALRFNLKIRHVYRGILLGTGPLVDPGFVGSLFIPLHNLTNRDYTLVGGKGLIWMEFTKIEPPLAGDLRNDSRPRKGQFFSFPASKRNQDLDVYLSRASPNAPIRSSLPVEIFNARTAAEDAAKSARRIRQIGVFAGIAVVVTLLALFIQVSLAFRDLSNDIRTHEAEMRRQAEALRSLATPAPPPDNATNVVPVQPGPAPGQEVGTDAAPPKVRRGSPPAAEAGDKPDAPKDRRRKKTKQ